MERSENKIIFSEENSRVNFPSYLEGRAIISDNQIELNNKNNENFYSIGVGVDDRKYMLIKINLHQKDAKHTNNFIQNLENATDINLLKYYGLFFNVEDLNYYLTFELPIFNFEYFIQIKFPFLSSKEKFWILREIFLVFKNMQEKGENNPLVKNLKFYFIIECGDKEIFYFFKFLNLGGILSFNKNSNSIVDIPFVKEIYRALLIEQRELFKKEFQFPIVDNSIIEPNLLAKFYLFTFSNLINYAFIKKNGINMINLNNEVSNVLPSEIPLQIKTFILIYSNPRYEKDSKEKNDNLMNIAWVEFMDFYCKNFKNSFKVITNNKCPLRIYKIHFKKTTEENIIFLDTVLNNSYQKTFSLINNKRKRQDLEEIIEIENKIIEIVDLTTSVKIEKIKNISQHNNNRKNGNNGKDKNKENPNLNIISLIDDDDKTVSLTYNKNISLINNSVKGESSIVNISNERDKNKSEKIISIDKINFMNKHFYQTNPAYKIDSNKPRGSISHETLPKVMLKNTKNNNKNEYGNFFQSNYNININMTNYIINNNFSRSTLDNLNNNIINSIANNPTNIYKGISKVWSNKVLPENDGIK